MIRPSDPNFWAMVSALATAFQAIVLLISLITIGWQIQRFREESISGRIAGLQTALDLLGQQDMQKIDDAIAGLSRPGAEEWRSAFETLGQIALLVDMKYTDTRLLLKLKGHDLTAIARYLREKTIPEESRKLLDAAKYKSVRSLLLQAETYVERGNL